MKNNKLYAAAMLADEIGALKSKAILAKNVMDNIMNERMPEPNLERTDPEILTLVAEAYKELLWKIDIVRDYLLYIHEKLYELKAYSDKYYDDGEKFILDIYSLLQEAVQNNGKVSSKKLLFVLGKGISNAEQRRC